MVVEFTAPTPPSCPPHYWLIEMLSPHAQQWTCQRCGAGEEHQDELLLRYRWTSRRGTRKAGNPSNPSGTL